MSVAPTAPPDYTHTYPQTPESIYQHEKDTSFEYAQINFQTIFDRYEINPYFHNYLEQLSGYKPVFVCDDSGSMNSPSDMIFEGKRVGTRWDELKLMVRYAYGIFGGICRSGIDMYFLNQPDVFVQDSHLFEKVEHLFEKRPSGRTPIVTLMERLFTQYHKQKAVYIIITDGAPCGSTEKDSKQDLNINENRIKIGVIEKTLDSVKSK